MKQRRNRARQKQINILHTTTRKRHSRQQLAHAGLWGAALITVIVAVMIGLHFGLSVVLDRALYQNSRYRLSEIDIQPRGHFSSHLIRQAAGLEPGQNLWALDLAQITRDVEKLPSVSSARVERHFPDKITIRIVERQPVVKIVGNDVVLGTPEPFYLDRDCYVLKPREDETVPFMPQVIGLNNAELEPGVQLVQPGLACALKILEALDHTPLHTLIDIRSIDLSQPLSITMVTTRDMTITFRFDNIDQQLLRLGQIIDYADHQQRTIRTVDLTPDRNVPVIFYE